MLSGIAGLALSPARPAEPGVPLRARRLPISLQTRTRVNHQIRLSPVRLIGHDGTQIGVVSIEDAREAAREVGLDLVEVDPNARPIVCKIMDWGKAKYELAKKEKLAKRHEKTLEIKQVKFRPGIDDHDFDTKLSHARRFLEEGKRTKVTIMFRRRDLRRPENGIRVLDRVAEELGDVAKVETRPGKIENRDLTMVLVPLAGVGHSTKKPAHAKPDGDGQSRPVAAKDQARSEKGEPAAAPAGAAAAEPPEPVSRQ